MSGVLLFLCFVALRWYPLDGTEWQGIKTKLAQAHAEKEKAYLAQHGYEYVA